MNNQFPPVFMATMPKDSVMLTHEQILQWIDNEYMRCHLQMKKNHLEIMLNMRRGRVPEYELRDLQFQYVQCIWEMSG